eukprot:snap_masked-scaffold_15-processed-gene-3.1-mRNA-1 protein AED:0.13 eAED:0.13 QI:0/0/0/0.33/1/1/3/0/248
MKSTFGMGKIKSYFNLGLGQFQVELEERAVKVVENLGLSKYELNQLKIVFANFNSSMSEELDYQDFLRILNAEDGVLPEALFKLVDLDDSGKIDYSEFVVALGSFCCYSKVEVLRFVFDIFDADGSGSLDEKEFKTMCLKINNGKPTFAGSFKKALSAVDSSGDGLIDFQEFVELNKRFPMLAFPAFNLQDEFQKSTLGEKAWVDIMNQKKHSTFIDKFKNQNDGEAPSKSPCTKCKEFFLGKRFDGD